MPSGVRIHHSSTSLYPHVCLRHPRAPAVEVQRPRDTILVENHLIKASGEAVALNYLVRESNGRCGRSNERWVR